MATLTQVAGGLMLSTESFDEIAATVFIDVAIIVVVARLMGALFRRLGQPAVVGEILAGIALGPSLLGLIPGSWFGLDTSIPNWMFPPEVRPFLRILAELGLIIFMFIVGLELDVNLIRGRERIAAGISLTSIVLPFSLGIGLAAVLYGGHQIVRGEQVEFLPFALFIGASMSITAFPVLARILTERGMHRTPIGALTLAAAAVDDILAWSMLALVLAVVESSGGSGGVGSLLRIMTLSIVFVVVMFTVVKPALAKLVPRYNAAGRLSPDILAVVIVGFLVCSFITSKIGIHSIFGAFVFGAVMPREGAGPFTHEILERLEQVSVLLLLPVFFIATGLNVDVSGLGTTGLAQLLLVLLVACAGKFIGATGAARVQGISWSRAAAIGTLMNTRGLTELVILNIGLSVGVLTTDLFTILVCMAIVTTVITEPLLRVFYPDRLLRRDVAEAERAALGIPDAYRVIVSIGEVDDLTASNLVNLAITLAAGEDPAEIVLCRFQPQVQRMEVGSGLVGELGSFTDSLGRLQELRVQVEQEGLSCVVRSQFTVDAWTELTELAEAVFADVVVVPASNRSGDAGSTEAEKPTGTAPIDCMTVTVHDAGHPLGTGGLVRLDPGANDSSAEVAFRLAAARHLDVEVTTDDRAGRRWHAALERGGLGHAEGPDRAQAVAVTVGGPDTPRADGPPGLTLAVTPAINASDRLFELVERLASGTRTSPVEPQPNANEEHTP